MRRANFTTLALSTLLSSSLAIAQESVSDEKSFFSDEYKFTLHFGVQGATLEPDGLGVYTKDLHNNSESRDLGGIYFGGMATLSEVYFIQADRSHLARLSGSISLNFDTLIIGRHHRLSDTTEVFAALGGAQVIAHRRNRRLRIGDDQFTEIERSRNKQTAALGRLGIGWLAAPRLYTSPSYSFAHLDGGEMHRVDLENQLAINRFMSVALNFNYTHWDTVRQPGWQLGLVLRF